MKNGTPQFAVFRSGAVNRGLNLIEPCVGAAGWSSKVVLSPGARIPFDASVTFQPRQTTIRLPMLPRRPSFVPLMRQEAG